MERHIAVPFSEEELKELHAGDYIYLTGTIYSARDAAHKRMYDAICVEQEKHPEADYTGAKLYEDKILPLDITGNTIYYLGPTPAKRDRSSVPQDLPRAAVWINIHRFCFQRG